MDDSSNSLIEGDYDATDKDGFSLIDGLELDDLFVSMSEPSQGDNKVNMVDGGLNAPGRLETDKPKKNGKYNLRKSLAWDSAFFTSAGVLDAEELSSIMEGGNGHLPGIQEDVTNSTDSLSTLESDNLTLESLEADLFCDIRASIQRSGEASRSRNSNLNDILVETSHLGKKTSETEHGKMFMPKSTPKKLNGNLQGNAKAMKAGPSREQVRKPVGSIKEPTSSLPKPAAASAKGSTNVMAPVKVPTKRMSISARRIKSDTSHLGMEMGRATTVSKGDRQGDPRSIIPKGASHSKSSSFSSTIPKGASHAKPSSVSSTNTRTGIPYGSTSSSSSQSPRILPLNGMHGKPIKPAGAVPPGVKSRIPSRVPVKSKNPPSNSRILAKLSSSTLSSSVSPTSSISEWSSCSSTVTANQEHSASMECSSLHRTLSLDSNASQDLQHPNQQGSCGGEEVASSKPSGLRMPSPKIGFFDGVKSGGRTQNAAGSTQSRCRISSSRLPRLTPGNSSPNRGGTGNATAKSTPLAGQNFKSDTGKSNLRITDVGGHLEGMLPAEESNSASEDFNKTTLLETSEENNSAVAKLPVGENQQLPSAREKSGECQTDNEKDDPLCAEINTSMEAGNANNSSEFAVSYHNVASSEDLLTKTTSLKTSEENNSGVAKLPVGEKQQLPSARKKSGSSKTKKATPQGKAVSQTNQVRIAVEADDLVKEINSLSIEPNNTLYSDEPADGDTMNTELDSINMPEEVGNGSKFDGSSSTIVLCEKHKATNGKNDPDCPVINMSKEAGNASKANENADTRIMSGECQTDNEKDPLCAEINTSMEAGNANNSSEFAVSYHNVASSEDLLTKTTSLKTSEENNSGVAKLPVGEKQQLPSARKKSGSSKTKKATPQGKADSQTNQIRSAVEADDLVKEINSLSIEPNNTLYSDEPTDGDTMNTELDSINMPEEVGNGSKFDGSSSTIVLCEKHKATNGKNDPDCPVINMSKEAGNASKANENADTRIQSGECQTDNEKDPLCAEINTSMEAGNGNNSSEFGDTVVLQKEKPISEKSEPVNADIVDMFVQVCNGENADANVQSGGNEATTEKIDLLCTEINISEEVGNAIKIDDNPDTDVQSGGYEAPSESNDPICDQQNSEPQGDSSSVCDSDLPAVPSAVELSGMKEDSNAANLHMQTDISFSSPCARTPFSDKNSSPGGFSVGFLVKRFTSLSLDNNQEKDVETETA